MIEITKENYEEVKKQLAEFEEENKRELEEKKRLRGVLSNLKYFFNEAPIPQGLLCYPTKVTMSIDYNVSTPNFQGETGEHKDITISNEMYSELLWLIKKRINELEYQVGSMPAENSISSSKTTPAVKLYY